jgi:GMP synthase-like glutamine amidotransferase
LRIHYFQHVPFEGLGSMEKWISSRRYPLSVTRFHKNDPLPRIGEIDWLIVMGGPMGVHDEATFPWLNREKRFIEQAIGRGKTVLGICLGAQLIASVLGAEVYPNRAGEIGWFPVVLTEEGRRCSLFRDLPPRINVLQWHNDTFDLPPGALHIAYSEACRHQAFLYGSRVLGLQFHLESGREEVKDFIRESSTDWAEGPCIQTPADILAEEGTFALANRTMEKILTRMGRRCMAE